MRKRRVPANLIENALKNGKQAGIEFTVLGDEAVATVIDAGPGLPDAELDQVIQPIASHRSKGVGSVRHRVGPRRLPLGRAGHWADVRLRRSIDGFCAIMWVPLVYGAVRAVAA